MASEQYGFVFSVTFIIIMSAVLLACPTGLSGSGDEPEEIGNISPSLLGDYTNVVNWSKASYSGTPIAYFNYDLNSLHWSAMHTATGYFYVAAKDYIGGIIWLGGYWYCDFQAPDGTNRGSALTLDEIDADSSEGSVTYTMMYHANGKSAGGFIVGWDSDTYSSASDAWDAGEISLLHGVGFAETATNNIGALIVGLLTFSLPDVPVLLGLLIGTPMWACIFFILWFIIKEMIPFL